MGLDSDTGFALALWLLALMLFVVCLVVFRRDVARKAKAEAAPNASSEEKPRLNGKTEKGKELREKTPLPQAASESPAESGSARHA